MGVDSVGGGCEEEVEGEVEERSGGCRSEETDHDGFDRTSSIVGCVVVFDEDRVVPSRDRGKWTERTLAHRLGK